MPVDLTPEDPEPPPLPVSFIIPALNESERIAHSVETAFAAGACEVVVADGGSGDDTANLAQKCGATVIHSITGRAAQQNAGASVARGEVLLFQHADNWCDPESVAQIRRALADASVQGGAFRQRIDAPGSMFRVLEWGNACRVRFRRLPFGDQGIFMRKRLFDELGGFPDVPLMEDVLLMRKFREKSIPILLNGPHHVSARRWQRHGVVRQTLRNWRIQWAHWLGTSPEDLAAAYRRHDQ